MSSPPPGPPPQEPTVYVIDDDESIRELLVWLMKRNAIRAEAFPNAKSFLKAYRPGVPGCLVLDLYMPGMSGLDLLPKAKAARPDVPVIMITAYGDADTARRAREGGAEGLLTKPIDFAALRAEIDQRIASV